MVVIPANGCDNTPTDQTCMDNPCLAGFHFTLVLLFHHFKHIHALLQDFLAGPSPAYCSLSPYLTWLRARMYDSTDIPLFGWRAVLFLFRKSNFSF